MLKILLLVCIALAEVVQGCNLFKRAGENAAHELRKGMEESSRNLQRSLEDSSRVITRSIDSAVNRLEILGKSVSSELGQSIKQASSDLVKISGKVTDSIDKGVKEMSSVMKDAISTTQKITDKLLDSADKAVDKVGKQIENAVNTIREISSDLAKSIDKGVAELGTTLRYVADKMAEMAKQVEVKVDSNHLVGVANTTGEALIRSVQELTTNWELAVNTADFKDIGQGAAAELSKALQNLRVYFEVHLGMDDNMRQAVLYISVAVCIAFSVCFVAMVIALKSCRSCTVKIFMLIIESCKSIPSKDNDGDIEAAVCEPSTKPKSNITKTKINNLDEKPLKRHNNMKIISDCDIDSDSENESMGNDKKGNFSKRQTMSLADYNVFSTVRNKWERRANKNRRVNGSTTN